MQDTADATGTYPSSRTNGSETESCWLPRPEQKQDPDRLSPSPPKLLRSPDHVVVLFIQDQGTFLPGKNGATSRWA
jgi:hypothetical protein